MGFFLVQLQVVRARQEKATAAYPHAISLLISNTVTKLTWAHQKPATELPLLGTLLLGAVAYFLVTMHTIEPAGKRRRDWPIIISILLGSLLSTVCDFLHFSDGNRPSNADAHWVKPFSWNISIVVSAMEGLFIVVVFIVVIISTQAINSACVCFSTLISYSILTYLLS